jgi:hypothetical protein
MPTRSQVAKALGGPWRAGAIWIVLQVIAVWTVLCVVLLTLDLEEGAPDDQANSWVLGLLIVPWVLFLLRYLMICLTPASSDSEAPYNVDYELWREGFAMAHFAMQRGRTPDERDLVTIQTYSQNTEWNVTDS